MGILIIFVIALLLAWAFSPRGKNSYAPVIVFFFILFLSGVAAQFWIVPFGPVFWGIAWIPVLVIILIIALLFSAPSPYERRKAPVESKEEASTSTVAIGLFVWVLFILLLVAVLTGYFRTSG